MKGNLKLVSAVAILSAAAQAITAIPVHASAESADPFLSSSTATQDYLSRYLGRRYQGRSVIPLRQLLDLDERYRGRRVEFVALVARTDFGRGNAELVVNGRPVGIPQQVGQYTQTLIFYPDAYESELGHEIRTLQLELEGRLHVESVAVQLATDYGYDDQDEIRVPLYQRKTGYSTLHVRQILGLDERYRGRRVEEILLTAASDHGRAQAQLVINGRRVGMPEVIDRYSREISLRPEYGMDVIGQDVRTIEIELRGNVDISGLGVRLDRGYGGGYPSYPYPSPYPNPDTQPYPRPRPGHPPRPVEQNVVTRRVNQHYQGGAVLRLRDLLNLGPEFNGREVESISLLTTAAHGAGTAELLIDGVSQDRALVRNQLETVVLRPSRYDDRLGTDIQSVQVRLDGRFYVDSVTVQLRPRNQFRVGGAF